MTVIYSNFGDNDTRVLERMWKDMDAYVVDVTVNDKESIGEAIRSEKDLLLLCGHGTMNGLLHPYGGYAVDDKMLRNNLNPNTRLIGIWCNASDFARFYGYCGFFSDMFISNSCEAEWNGIEGYTDNQIWSYERVFCDKVNVLLTEGIPLKEWKDILMASYDLDNRIEDFNYKGLAYLWW